MSFFFMTGSPLSIFFQNVSGAAGTAAVTFARRAGGIWGLFSYVFPPWAKKKRQSASGALPRTVCPLRYAANCRHRETCAGCRSQLHMHIIMPSRRSKQVMTASPFGIKFACNGDSIPRVCAGGKVFAAKRNKSRAQARLAPPPKTWYDKNSHYRKKEEPP